MTSQAPTSLSPSAAPSRHRSRTTPVVADLASWQARHSQPDPTRAAALDLVRQHIASTLRPGDRLPSMTALCQSIGTLTETETRTALRTLNDLGEILHNPRIRSRVLAPGETHPHDTALVAAIRVRVRSGHYRAGQALPTGLLAAEFGLTPEQVTVRACRELVRDGLMHHSRRGPHGPGLYICPQRERPSSS
ncbi:hypothetical protein [Streptomyces sp. NPDC005525]|uniref:hypothetical protein n=1 Tax=Streptomyces sp. NPDC005525 TaxID=3364720 RepID=UPI0036CB39A5